MGKKIGENASKSLNVKYSSGMLTMCQKRLCHAKQSARDAFKSASKWAMQITAEATGDLIGNKIANKFTVVSKIPQQNNSETVTNEHDKEIPNNRIYTYNNRISKNHKSFKKFTTK